MSSKSNVSFLELGPSLLLKICRLVFVLLPCPEYLFCNNVCNIKDGNIFKGSQKINIELANLRVRIKPRTN